MKRKRLLAAGGDLRQLAAAAALAETCTVWLTGLTSPGALPAGVEAVPQEALAQLAPDALLLPMPAEKQPGEVYAPHSAGILHTEQLTALLPAGAPVLGGRMADSLCARLRAAGLRPLDYAKEEAFAVRNAVPTAEGALEIALRTLPVTLWQLPVLLLGAGRISRALQPRLRGLGAEVTVAARRFADLARSEGGKGKHMRGEKRLLRSEKPTSPSGRFGRLSLPSFDREQPREG